jgi:L-2-hydroxyglutarate oxidase LhgO
VLIHDVVVVGAGLVGLATARELLRRRPGLRLAVVDKERTVAAHQSGHNSGVIHAGIYYAPGTLKARLCVEGARDLVTYCRQRDIPLEEVGKVIVATTPEEHARLEELCRRGTRNGVADLEVIGPERLHELEPEARGLGALHSPHTGIVDFAAVARAYAADVQAAGGTLRLGEAVSGLHDRRPGLTVVTEQGALITRALVVCGGLQADRLAALTGGASTPPIVPFRGSFYRLRPDRAHLVRGLIYPVPLPGLPFLGVHFTRRIGGEVWLGPTAMLAFAREGYSLGQVAVRDLREMGRRPELWAFVRRHFRQALVELSREVSRERFAAEGRRFLPALSASDLEPAPAGVRAMALGEGGQLVDDFVVDRQRTASGHRVLHVRNAPSPAATSSLALGRLIADTLERS